MKPTNAPLSVKVVDDKLVISIGVSTLAFAVENNPNGRFEDVEITNPKLFARDVATELSDDSEEGDSPLQRLLDDMAERAIEGGSGAVHLLND